MSLIRSLHEARKQRLQRIAARAVPELARTAASGVVPRNLNALRRRPDPQDERAWSAVIMGWSEPAAPPVRVPRIVDVQRATAHHFGVSRKAMLAPGRAHLLVMPRHVAMFLAKRMTPKSFGEIGRAFGGRDHSTALYAVGAIERRLDRDAELARHVARIRQRIEDDIWTGEGEASQ